MRLVGAAEAVACVRSGAHVFLHGGAATPSLLLDALAARAAGLTDVSTVAPNTSPSSSRTFRSCSRAAPCPLTSRSSTSRRRTRTASARSAVDVARAAVRAAKIVVAQINRAMPRTHGIAEHARRVHFLG
jgi:acyl-CoA hydrolase